MKFLLSISYSFYLYLKNIRKRKIKFIQTFPWNPFQFANIQGTLCQSIAFTRTGQHMVTAGEKVLKVWDYKQADRINHQVSF